MGTRSLTVLGDGNGGEIAVMYRQMDGYPEGHGRELAEFLDGMVVVNGINLGETRKMANGPECLAAQVVAHFKDDVGGIYLHPAGTRDCWEEYVYFVLPITTTGEIVLRCARDEKYGNGKVLFEGTPADFLKFGASEEDEEEDG